MRNNIADNIQNRNLMQNRNEVRSISINTFAIDIEMIFNFMYSNGLFKHVSYINLKSINKILKHCIFTLLKEKKQ